MQVEESRTIRRMAVKSATPAATSFYSSLLFLPSACKISQQRKGHENVKGVFIAEWKLPSCTNLY